ncbi:MAG: hypothetical protein Q8N57_00050 [bacterium]|nr:hypothetical protein [bacterium]
MAAEKKLETPRREKITSPLSRPEKIASPEIKAERVSAVLEKAPETLKTGETAPVATRPVASAALGYQEQRAQAIDAILAEGLNEVYLKMDAPHQQEFKKRGEEIVKKINLLLSKTKVRANKIIALIKAWLKLIPGINHFFLEQEAKIKTDKIIRIKDTF